MGGKAVYSASTDSWTMPYKVCLTRHALQGMGAAGRVDSAAPCPSAGRSTTALRHSSTNITLTTSANMHSALHPESTPVTVWARPAWLAPQATAHVSPVARKLRPRRHRQRRASHKARRHSLACGNHVWRDALAWARPRLEAQLALPCCQHERGALVAVAAVCVEMWGRVWVCGWGVLACNSALAGAALETCNSKALHLEPASL